MAAITSAVSGGEVTVPFVAEATFRIRPPSRSACVTEWDALQVIEAPGASDAVAGHVTVTLLSLTVNGPWRVTLPVFVTTYVYEMTWLTWSYESGDAVLTTPSAGDCTI